MIVSGQFSKLMVHSAPGAHISVAGRTFFGHMRLMCARFPTQLLYLYIYKKSA